MAKKFMVSCRGTLVHPWLQKPDTKFKAEGQYKTGLRGKANDPKVIKLMTDVDAAVAVSLASAMDKADTPKAKKLVKACEDLPYRIETDDDDNPTGYVIFNFKMIATGTNRKTGEDFEQKPALFDAVGTPLPDADAQIGAGTEAKISYEITEFYQVKTGAGVSLRMKAVQILKLVKWGGGGDSGYYGFGDESDGTFPDVEAEDDGGDEVVATPTPPKAKTTAKKTKPPVEKDDF